MENITLTEFIDSVIEQNLDEKTSAWQTPTRKKLIFILKGLEKIGIVTKNKLKSDIEKDVHELINNSQVSALTKKTLFELFNLYSDNYGRLREESIQEQIDQNNDLIQNTYNEWQGTRGMYTPTLEQQAKLDAFNVDHRRHIEEVGLSVKDRAVERERVMEFFNNPKKMFTKIDKQGDVYIIFPECGQKGMKIKSPDFSKYSFTKNEITILRDKDLINTSSTGSEEYLYRKTLSNETFKKMLDDAEKKGYEWNAKKEDVFMYYIAQEFGLSYNPRDLGKPQPILQIKMALLNKKFGGDFLNRNKEGVNGDKYGKINGNDNDNIQYVRMDYDYQRIMNTNDEFLFASITLVGDNNEFE